MQNISDTNQQNIVIPHKDFLETQLWSEDPIAVNIKFSQLKIRFSLKRITAKEEQILIAKITKDYPEKTEQENWLWQTDFTCLKDFLQSIENSPPIFYKIKTNSKINISNPWHYLSKHTQQNEQILKFALIGYNNAVLPSEVF
jgi:hypothetical protein